jgi:hypothetical protein
MSSLGLSEDANTAALDQSVVDDGVAEISLRWSSSAD